MLRVWMQESTEPSTNPKTRPGRWVTEPSWPAPEERARTYLLNAAGTLDDAPLPETRIEFTGAQGSGLDAGIWCPMGEAGDHPPDQRAEDGRSLCFTSAPLEEPAEILGFPKVALAVATDRPNALLAVRLCDVSPTGVSSLVTRGLLNLTHRASHEHPEPLEPGKRYAMTVHLDAIAHSMPAGHRWRVAVSPTYWPHAWPSPEPVTLTVFAGESCRLDLPVRTPGVGDGELSSFEPSEIGPPLEVEVLSNGLRRRNVHHDMVHDAFRLVDHSDWGRQRLPGGLEYEESRTDTYYMVEGDPLSAKVKCEWAIEVGRADWSTRVETTSDMTSDARTFRVTNVLDAYEGNTRLFSKARTITIPRDLV